MRIFSKEISTFIAALRQKFMSSTRQATGLGERSVVVGCTRNTKKCDVCESKTCHLISWYFMVNTMIHLKYQKIR